MSLYNALPGYDKTMILSYFEHYGDSCPGDLEHILRYWAENKEDLFHAFGDKFILKKDVYFEKDEETLTSDMTDKIFYGDSDVRLFVDQLRMYVDDKFNVGSIERMYLKRMFWDSDELVCNEWRYESFVVPKDKTVTGRDIQITKGCKIVKMLGKLTKAFGLNEELYEQFRQAHSQVLNQKRAKGRLCLSIHPMDYITMSDNCCGWTSCMSWNDDDEPGDYRLGTIEMMNSPWVVVAYMEDDHTLNLYDGHEWNNKRWRQLFIVNREMILGNKQYPYESEELQGTALNWLRDLMNVRPGYGPYDQTSIQLKNNALNTIDGHKQVYFRISCNYMYNDVYDTRTTILASQKFEDDDSYDFNFSGEAICVQCGNIIELDSVEANQVVCRQCSGEWRCESCGEWMNSWEEDWEVEGRSVCRYCYNDSYTCEVCGERTFNETYIPILINTDNTEIIDRFNHSFKIVLCDSCIHFKDYEELFGPLLRVPPLSSQYFELSNITDKGLESGVVSDESIKFLKALRDAKSDEEKIKVLDKYSY